MTSKDTRNETSFSIVECQECNLGYVKPDLGIETVDIAFYGKTKYCKPYFSSRPWKCR